MDPRPCPAALGDESTWTSPHYQPCGCHYEQLGWEPSMHPSAREWAEAGGWSLVKPCDQMRAFCAHLTERMDREKSEPRYLLAEGRHKVLASARVLAQIEALRAGAEAN